MLVALEGAVAVGFAIFLVVRGLLGADQSVTSGYGTAAWFLILGGAVLAAGVALLRGQRWGRTIALMAQLLLLPVTWYVLTSHRWFWGVLLGAVVLAALAMLSPAAPPAGWPRPTGLRTQTRNERGGRSRHPGGESRQRVAGETVGRPLVLGDRVE